MKEKRLRIGNEREFEFHGEKIIQLVEEIDKNKIDPKILEEKIDEYLANHDYDQSIYNGRGALLIEHPEKEKKIPPYTKRLSTEDKIVIKGYVDAEKHMLTELKALGFIDVQLINECHKEMFYFDDSVSLYQKGFFRNADLMEGWDFEFIPSDDIKSIFPSTLDKYRYDKKANLSGPEIFGRIAKLHAQMVRIQPYINGNKRIAFITTNAMLKLYGYPIIEPCANKEESDDYKNRLDKAIFDRDVTDLAEFFATKVKMQEYVLNREIEAGVLENKLTISKQDDLQK